MTIRKGEPWGEVGPTPEGAVPVATDAEARAVVEAARRAGEQPPPLLLEGGDLCRTLGGGSGRPVDPDRRTIVPIDLGSVLVDGRLHWFVAHLVARRSWWTGRVWAAMNAQYLGRWDVAPRAHPNDGRLDVLDASLPLGDRLKARSRLPSGTHVPHPAIQERRVTAVQARFEPPLDVWLDSERVGRATDVSVRVEPDALLCVV